MGNFDGVHRGHEQLIRRLVANAAKVGGKAIVFTFDPPPLAVLMPTKPLPAALTDMPRRAQLLGDLGVDLVVAYPTDTRLLSLTAEQFFQRILIEGMGARAIVEGPNFHFGLNRVGDITLLQHLCKLGGLALEIVAATEDGAGMLSSTRVRELISLGRISEANTLLTQPYWLTGRVSHGEGRGKKLGAATANLTDIPVLVPQHGVYAGCVNLGTGLQPAAIHIGPNPTFQEQTAKVEVHILDWTGELYNEYLGCGLLRELRSIRRFDSAVDLQTQIARDIEECRTVFRDYSAA